MKNLKKVLALVLACTMVFGLVATASTGYPDVADDATYAEAVKTLSALKILQGDENGNFNPDATITRAEMAKILCTMVKSGELAPTATKFADVAADHWAGGYIAYAQQLGYIDGYDATTFGPEDPVTYEQVVKLIMAALNYTYVAEQNGGYPTGYLFAAADVDVTKGVSITKGSDPAPRSTVAVLVNNAMNAPIMERTTYGTESVWEKMDGTGTKAFKSLLTERHKTYKVEGKVTDSYKQNTNKKDGFVDVNITKTLKIDVENVLNASPVDADKNNIVDYYRLINVDATGTDAADLIGYECVMYFQETDGGDYALVAIARKSVKNVEIVLSDVSQAYDSSKDSGVRTNDLPSLTQFSYWNDRDTDTRITTVDLASSVDVIWNNAKSETLADRFAAVKEKYWNEETQKYDITDADAVIEAIVPERGSVTLVDTGNDGDYDLIRVTAYDVAIVNRVNDSLKMVTFFSDKTMDASYITLTTDEYPELKEYSITLDGKAIDIKDLQQYDVLTIATNSWEEPTYFDIIVTRNVVEGAVTEKNEAEEYVVINGEEYEITQGFRSLRLPDLEDEGKFYLDAEGRIAYYDVSSVSNGNFAYLYRTGTGTFEGENYIRMFTKDSQDVSYRIADKVRINKVYKNSLDTQYTWADIASIFGVAVEGAADAGVNASDIFEGASNTALTPAVFINTLVEGQFALKPAYKLTGNKDADKFVTYTASDDRLTEITLANSNRDMDEFGYKGTTNGDVEWKASLSQFKNTSSNMADNAVIFFVSNKADATIDDFQVKTIADLKDGNLYKPYFFMKSDDGITAALILNIEPTLGSDLAVFEKYTLAKDNGDDVYLVTYWQNGKRAETPMVAERMDEVTAMKKGDAFIYATNDKGRVDSIAKIFSPGATQIPFGADLSSYIDLSNSEVADEYEFLGESGEHEKDNQVYFGYVGKTADTKNGGLRVTLLDETGKFSNSQAVVVPETANVIYYNPAMAELKQLQESTKDTITASNFVSPEKSEDVDFITSKPENMNYAFVRIYNDVVTDVIYVRYKR